MISETEKKITIPEDQYYELSPGARYLYTTIYDYCTYASDPQYKTLHEFRKSISKLGGRDREILIDYFNNDPAINWNGISSEPWLYYEKPY